MSRVRFVPMFVSTAVLAAVVAGCGTSEKPGASGVSAAESSASSIVAAGDDKAAPIDVCSLLSAQDVSTLLGATVQGASSDSRCVWENPANLESVSVEIGSPDTAINGTLKPPEPGLESVYTPGPEGMRFMGPGSVEFVAGHRANTVQVAVLAMISAGTANDAAVDLARKIAPQIPG